MALLDYYRQFEGMSDERSARGCANGRASAAGGRWRKIDPLDLSQTTWHELPHPDVVAAITYAARRGINRSAIRRPPSCGARSAAATAWSATGSRWATALRSSCSAAARTLIEPGDELVTPWPSYPLYPLMARAAGGRAVPVTGGGAGGGLRAVSERTRLIALCNPNDPNGSYLPADASAASCWSGCPSM